MLGGSIALAAAAAASTVAVARAVVSLRGPSPRALVGTAATALHALVIRPWHLHSRAEPEDEKRELQAMSCVPGRDPDPPRGDDRRAGREGVAVARPARAGSWRLLRQRPEPQYVSVGDVAARFGVTTQAVYKWLRDERIEATRGPGGSWLIPAAQFERHGGPATSRRELDELKQHLVRVQEGHEPPSEDELTASMRASDQQ
jgi:excisionase family DNA binding protein